MKKFILIIFIAITGLVGAAKAQHALFSQYMFNTYLINPGVAGINDQIEASVGYRNQWVYFEGAPKTIYASIHSPLNKKGPRYNKKDKPYHALGGYIFSDKYGPIQEFGANVSYTYHMSFTQKIKASFGMYGGVRQYIFNKNEMTTFIENDPRVSSLKNELSLDGGFGSWIYSDNVYLGISGNDLLSFSGFAFNNYYLTSGYRHRINRDLEVIPSFLLKATHAAPFQVDINAKLRLYNMYWAGLSYRTNKSVVVLAGLKLKEMLAIGYSYDIPWMHVEKFRAASHEIFVTYYFGKPGVRCPEFW
ncbi:MAG TPA: type IX secretion system membrane protein PorP/SprF [Cytophagaceae bacterium]